MLAEGEPTVGELTRALPITQPAVSQHLKVLKHIGLVNDRAEGTKRIYRLNEAGVAALRDQSRHLLEADAVRLRGPDEG